MGYVKEGDAKIKYKIKALNCSGRRKKEGENK